MTSKRKYLNPYTDFGFKKLFGSEPNKDLLINFLNQLLPAKHRIKDLAFTTNERLGQTVDARHAIFDLFCTSRTGERFIIEMQKAQQNFFKERSVFYASFPIQDQGERGEGWNFKLDAVYLIGILDFVFAEDKDDLEVMHTVQLKDQHNRVFYDKLTFIYLEMPKFKKTESELMTPFDKWLYVIKYLPTLQARPAKLQERVFAKLFKAAEIGNFTPEERAQYEGSLMVYRDLNNVIETAEEKGDKKRALSVARNALEEKLPIKLIAKLTGLSEIEIEALQKTSG